MNNITKAELRKRLGNITQLQELLFGEQIEAYDRQISQCNQRLNQLEENSRQFQLAIEERMSQFEHELLHKINSVSDTLEKKLEYLDLTTKKEQERLQQELKTIAHHSYENINYLQTSLKSKTNALKAEITQSKSTLDRDIQQLKQQLLTKLESNLTDSANKLSRRDLAEVLFELSLKLKDQDVTSELTDEQADITTEDYILVDSNPMLPEQK